MIDRVERFFIRKKENVEVNSVWSRRDMWTCEHQGVIRQEQNNYFWKMVAFYLAPLKLNENVIDVCSMCPGPILQQNPCENIDNEKIILLLYFSTAFLSGLGRWYEKYERFNEHYMYM